MAAVLDMQKISNELPNTDEVERAAATLVVQYEHVRRNAFDQWELALSGTHLRVVWAVDFYRGRPEVR